MFTLLLATAVAFSQTDSSQGLPEVDRVQSLQRAAELGPEVPPGSRDEKVSTPRSNVQAPWTISVDVWSAAPSVDAKPKDADPAALSRGFAVAALNAANRLKFTERRIANSIKMGFPLGEFWIQSDFDAIDDSLAQAALSATNDADREALQQLETQTQHLRLWSDWLIKQNRQLRLAEYYISAAPLDNDERFQNTVSCTNFLMSMLASGRLAENSSCM
ncbi:MAG TPA: hypothetical protein VG498_23525 [Terriglobales bacterium]|nr:hypothetical protein [Terriglobales bacterium]